MVITQVVEFETYIYDCLYFYAQNFSVVKRKKIKETYGLHIDNIDFLIMINENIFLIKCNFDKDRPNLYNINTFISECEYLRKKLKKSYNFHLIYLSRISSVLNNSTCVNIFLYAYPTVNLKYDSKEYEYLLMRLYNYMVYITNIRLGLKEYLSNDVLMSYII
jgi:hypothetical protein